jgi:DNA-binding MarR family transcriptional regulator
MSSESVDRAELLQRLERELRRTSAQSVLFSQAVADRLGMNPTDLESLDILNWTGPITAGRLAELSGLTTGAITGIVDRLEKAGYVRRKQDPHDRRRVILHLLPGEAQRKIAPLFDATKRATMELCSRYSDQELALILDFTTRANQIVQQETAKLRAEAAPGGAPQSSDFSTPLGSATRGRLVFSSGASTVTILADQTMEDLYRAHFERVVPRVQIRNGTVSIEYHGFLFLRRSGPAEITLNGSVPWVIELQSGVSKLKADLRQLQLSSLTVTGGASRIDLSLPKPLDTVVVRVSGGASRLMVLRPAGVPARIHVSGGLSKLSLDGQRSAGIGDDVRWESPTFKSASDRYDVDISGGASRVTVDTWRSGDQW